MRDVTPALSARRRPLHRRLLESEAYYVNAAIARNTNISRQGSLTLLLQNESALFLELPANANCGYLRTNECIPRRIAWR
jgi:hypothetical protein